MNCPLCNYSKWRVLARPQGRIVRACLQCLNAWTDPKPGVVKYADMDFHKDAVKASQDSLKMLTIEDLPAEWRNAITVQISMVRRHFRAGARILEIGCGQGLVLKELAAVGFDVVGLEASVSAVQCAREKGLNIHQGMFPSSEVKGPFDLVIMSHVLEHIEDIQGVFRAVSEISPGGHLLLIQTNYKGFVPWLVGPKWNWVPDQHFWHFLPEGLHYIASLYLPDKHVESVSLKFSNLVHGGKTWLPGIVGKLLPRGSDQFHLLLRFSAKD